MFDFFKKSKKQSLSKCEITDEQVAAFFKADSEAREAAGLKDRPGDYTFICPNCGSKCTGTWSSSHIDTNHLYGRTDCFTCDIHLIV